MDRRGELLAALHRAGREHSNAAVTFHAAVGARTGLGLTEEKTLDLLERKGFVRRVRDRDDGRRVIVEIEREHVASFGGLFAGFVAGLEALCAGYSDEQLEVILDFMVMG
ncbi:hypothetical protein OG241_20500 [Streptomyces sp. NBC_01390]|uniref:hypothetical protein n=1 Tax=Streptomyces sp. NBC_01390 TaxID=2903850 RepID=UPI003250DDA5